MNKYSNSNCFSEFLAKTHLEVMVQNVKKAKRDRSSGSDRSSGEHGTC
jgi:hypothetical protein